MMDIVRKLLKISLDFSNAKLKFSSTVVKKQRAFLISIN